MNVKKNIYCMFFLLCSCMSSSQEKKIDNILIEQNKESNLNNENTKLSFLLLGYHNDIPIFREFYSNDLYCFEGEFKYFSKGKSGFAPVFCNDSIWIYAGIKSTGSYLLTNEIIVKKGETEKKISLPNEVSWLTSNTIGDTLYYTDGEKEVDRIRIFDVSRNIETLGVSLWYESFWYSRGKLIYSKPDMKDYLESSRMYIYLTKTPPIQEGELLDKDFIFSHLNTISSNGNYLVATEDFSGHIYSVINLATQEIKKITIEYPRGSTLSSFFYRNKVYFHSDDNIIVATMNLEEK